MAWNLSEEGRPGGAEPRGAPAAAPAALIVPLEVALPCSLKASARARKALRTWMAAIGLSDELVDDGALVVSETVTNAVVHARSAPRLFVSVVDGRVRVEVHDTSRELPVLRAGHVDVGGRGLHIVADVADDFGWSTTTTGKFVWAELRIPNSRFRRSKRTMMRT